MNNMILSNLKDAMINYDDIYAKKLAEESIKEGINPLDTINVLTKIISDIGDKFESGELWLPDLMMAAKTMQSAMQPLEIEIQNRGLKKDILGKVVIGTVYGDLHDIGKTMVATMLQANGFEVIDLGVNVDSMKFFEAIKKYNPEILAMSALLTTTAPEMERVISSLEQSGIREKIKIIIGGGPITQEFADKIGSDGYEPTAVLAVKLAKRLLEK